MTKNIGKSIKTRLLNLAKEEKQDYMKVLVGYLHERLLFRISASPYKSHFLLKGSSLLYALDGFKARPTIDIDLLGERISNDRDSLKRVFHFFMVLPIKALFPSSTTGYYTPSYSIESGTIRESLLSALEILASFVFWLIQ